MFLNATNTSFTYLLHKDGSTDRIYIVQHDRIWSDPTFLYP